MDHVDAAILREMLRGRTLLWGGGDPRLGAPDLAARVGVDRTTVWARLKAWKEDGFLLRQEVVPNPSLFGAGIAGGDVRVDDPRRKGPALAALTLVDGILAGLDQVGPYIIVLYALESEAALGRCRLLVGQLPDVAEASLCVPFEPPRSTLQPTARDWRLLKGLRGSPDVALADVAAQAGMSPRTLTRRYAQLLAANAIWTFPLLDFTRYRGAVFARFVVEMKGGGNAPALAQACRRGLAGFLWSDPVPGPGPAGEAAYVDVYCHLASAADVERVQQWLLDLPYVGGAETFFPKSWFMVPAWFDERIERALAAAEGRARG